MAQDFALTDGASSKIFLFYFKISHFATKRGEILYEILKHTSIMNRKSF
jgi:hypothetical protein